MGVWRGIELDHVVLHSGRLTLRPWLLEDAADVHAIMRDRSMWDFLALPDPYTVEVARQFVGEFAAAGRTAGTGLDCAVVDRVTGRLVGSASIRLGGPREAEVGYWVAREVRGRGYATEATRTLCDWAFGHGVERVRLLCDSRNLASVRVALGSAFRFEGVTRGARPDPHARAFDHCDLARFGRLAGDPPDAIAPAFSFPADGLGDGVLALRMLRGEDHDASTVMFDDPVSRQWDLFPQRSSDAARREAINAGLHALVGPQLRLAMVDVATGSFAGDLGVRPGPPQVGALGYSVHPDFRGRGYTTRALRLITAWAFETAGYVRLELGAKSGNLASQRSARNAGFVAEGELPVRLRNPDGSFSDERIFALVNPRYAGPA